MKYLLKSVIFSILLWIYPCNSHSQSASGFDADYFNKGTLSPPIQIGKGFHINDIYRQTKTCFTPETSAKKKLTQQNGSKKTSIKIFYARTNDEFNMFRSSGVSGGIGFLNLFAFEGANLQKHSNTNIFTDVRLIFSASTDFGNFFFDKEPMLTPEAKALIKQNKFQDFINAYGTHYISGVHKESRITVIITLHKSETTSQNGSKSGIGISRAMPFNGSASLEVGDENWVNSQLRSHQHSISIEIEGPPLDKKVIQGSISEILSDTNKNMASGIMGFISNAVSNISDPNQSIYTQYYYSPFSLYGVGGIYWDEKKQHQLTKINEVVIQVYSIKTLLDELLSESGKRQLDNQLTKFGFSANQKNIVMAKYNESLSELKSLNSTCNELLDELEGRYDTCASITCESKSECCNNKRYFEEFTAYDLSSRVNNELNKIYEVIEKITIDLNRPECDKREQGIVTIQNLSSNPYNLYQGNKFIETIPGHTSKSYFVNVGMYQFKAIQQSGYLLYATENNRQAVVKNKCEEITLKVGFED